MTIYKSFTSKEWILGLLLHMYIGGFAYYWGSATDDPYLMIVFAFLVTQLVSGRVTFNVILQRNWTYRISNRYLRLLLNFAVNVFLANVLVALIKSIHPGDMAEFLAGPMVYGFIFGILYHIFFLLGLSPLEEAGEVEG